MNSTTYPFTVRLVGFSPAEGAHLEAQLAQGTGPGSSYSCLHDDSLQEPDLLIANGDSPAALARLGCLPPGALQPALVIGAPGAGRWRTLARPVGALVLNDALGALLDARVQVLAERKSRGRRVVAERRRRPRLAPDAEAPAFYTRLRRGPPDGAVLIVDRGCTLRNQVARVLAPCRVPVEWTDSLCAAVRLCDETPVSLVMINTSAPGIEPYEWCRSIKAQEGAGRTPVVFLVGQSFCYDAARARHAGVRGLLDNPVAGRHLLVTFQKLLDLPV